ncbi:hypothetical protein BH11MYX2_BH11MYX2_03250 [soil metagenome]
MNWKAGFAAEDLAIDQLALEILVEEHQVIDGLGGAFRHRGLG